MIANLVWSAICLIPISVFCYKFMDLKWFYIFLSLSILTVFLPKSFFNILQLSKSRSLYEKAGINFINKFTQNGDIINRLIRKKYPEYKIVSRKEISIIRLLRQSDMFEKFHFMMFAFFAFTTFYALLGHFYLWALVITITNLIYNLYPIFLQQYIRLRLSSFIKKSEHQ